MNRWKIEFIDLIDHLAELEVQKYLQRFPYWAAEYPMHVEVVSK